MGHCRLSLLSPWDCSWVSPSQEAFIQRPHAGGQCQAPALTSEGRKRRDDTPATLCCLELSSLGGDGAWGPSSALALGPGEVTLGLHGTPLGIPSDHRHPLRVGRVGSWSQ